MSKKEQGETKAGWAPWYAVAKMMAVGLLLTAVAALVMTIVQFIGSNVADLLVK